jgi:hypothetical protein
LTRNVGTCAQVPTYCVSAPHRAASGGVGQRGGCVPCALLAAFWSERDGPRLDERGVLSALVGRGTCGRYPEPGGKWRVSPAAVKEGERPRRGSHLGPDNPRTPPLRLGHKCDTEGAAHCTTLPLPARTPPPAVNAHIQVAPLPRRDRSHVGPRIARTLPALQQVLQEPPAGHSEGTRPVRTPAEFRADVGARTGLAGQRASHTTGPRTGLRYR